MVWGHNKKEGDCDEQAGRLHERPRREHERVIDRAVDPLQHAGLHFLTDPLHRRAVGVHLRDVGSELLELLADAAITRGIRYFRASALAENVAVRKLVRRLAGRLARERHFGPVDEFEVDLAA